jgi:Clp amino terminal domain, pathogenicity island component
LADTTPNRERTGPLRPVTAQPTAGLWNALLDATSEALRRGHPRAGEEHLLYVLAARERSIAGGLLERHNVREAVRADLDAAMSRPDYLTCSNRVLDEEGNVVGHMFLGPDGLPFVELEPDAES